MTQYGEGCDHCGDPHPGVAYVNEVHTLCEPCYKRLIRSENE